MEYFVYILQSEKNSSYYVGQTKDISARLKKHNDGEVQYTKPNRPWKLVYQEQFKTRSEAIIREREIKSHKKRKFIENLIKTRNVAQPGSEGIPLELAHLSRRDPFGTWGASG